MAEDLTLTDSAEEKQDTQDTSTFTEDDLVNKSKKISFAEEIEEEDILKKRFSFRSDLGSHDGPHKDVLLNPSNQSQAVIESLEKNSILQSKPFMNQDGDSRKEVLPVDWLGIPLGPTTLPDFQTTTKMHFGRPKSAAPFGVGSHREEKDLFHEQFTEAKWVEHKLLPSGIVGGFPRKETQVPKLLVHPQSTLWEVPNSTVERTRKKDPVEYLNLLDPQNAISVEKAMYQWLLRDQADLSCVTSLGESERTSGFSKNRIPHVPLRESRDFHSIYKKSFCIPPIVNSVEGLSEPDSIDMTYPGYGGSKKMRDFPSSFVKFSPHVLKTNPNFLGRDPSDHRRMKSVNPPYKLDIL